MELEMMVNDDSIDALLFIQSFIHIKVKDVCLNMMPD
jgi:hypothetical protein